MKGFLIFLATLMMCAAIVVPVLYFTTDVFEDEDGGGLGPGEDKSWYWSDSFTVQNRSQHQHQLPMEKGDTLVGQFSITGGKGELRFSIRHPSGFVESHGMVYQQYSFSMAAPTDGYYNLIWDNSFSLLTDKRVSVNVRVVR